MAAVHVLSPTIDYIKTSPMQQPFIRPETCVECDGRVYAMEKLVAGSSVYHKWCFRCAYCNAVLSMNNYAMTSACIPYCKAHYAAIFKRKGNYKEFAVKRIEADFCDKVVESSSSESANNTVMRRWIQSTSLQPLNPVNRIHDVTPASPTSQAAAVNVRQTRAIFESIK